MSGLPSIDSTATNTPAIPVAHMDDPEAMAALCTALRGVHGDEYDFARLDWSGPTTLPARSGRVSHAFVVKTSADAAIALARGDLVRGAPDRADLVAVDDGLHRAVQPATVALWPGDLFIYGPDARDAIQVSGEGAAFVVTTSATDYRVPRVALLRYLDDRPGGCAAYPGAFRREALPPDRGSVTPADQRGSNRVNEHTLDMRYDREPTPIRHYHGPLTVAGRPVNHSEIAVVLPRSVYNLPEVGEPDQGHVIIHPDPAVDPAQKVKIPVTPGSIVVTPATPVQTMGHCFENAFAMLIAIPGFVAPYHMISDSK